MGRSQPRWADRTRILLAAFIIAPVAGCSAASSSQLRAPSSSSAVSCVPISGTTGADGAIQAGPFDLPAYQSFTSPAGSKLWVGSTRDALKTGASLTAVRLDQASSPVTQIRGPDTAAQVINLPVFYPGALHLPSAGRWRLTVSIGADTGCFDFDVH